MIDIHAHVIPFVDDGSSSIECSLQMLISLSDSGVKAVVCTPHYRHNYVSRIEQIEEQFAKLKERVLEEKIPINLYLGRELYISSDYKKLLSNERDSFTLNHSPYVLIEFDYTENGEIVEVAYELLNMGFIPIIAHVERYSYITESDVYEIKSMGGLIQVNADSIVGDNKKHYYKFIKKLFKSNLVDFVSSDLHEQRINHMAEARKFVAKKFGEDVANVVFSENAKKIIKG